MCDIAASFQHAALTDVIDKAENAAKQHHCQTVVFGGGVTNNQTLRQMVRKKMPELQILWPSPGLSLDNAAMIAGLGYHIFLRKNKSDPLDLDAATRIAF